MPIVQQKVFNAISNDVYLFTFFLAYGNKRNEYVLVPKKPFWRLTLKSWSPIGHYFYRKKILTWRAV